MGVKTPHTGLPNLEFQDATPALSPLSYNEVDFFYLSESLLDEQQTLFQKDKLRSLKNEVTRKVKECSTSKAQKRSRFRSNTKNKCSKLCSRAIIQSSKTKKHENLL